MRSGMPHIAIGKRTKRFILADVQAWIEQQRLNHEVGES